VCIVDPDTGPVVIIEAGVGHEGSVLMIGLVVGSENLPKFSILMLDLVFDSLQTTSQVRVVVTRCLL